jgi:DNA ligase-1
MTTITETPVLQAASSTGKTKFWRCRVVTDGVGYFLVSEAWTAPPESQHLVSAPAQVQGKNTGRANATTPEAQAVFAMGAKQRKKETEGYTVGGVIAPAAREFPLPMLAHPLAKRPDFTYPVLCQPKLNGMRCLYNGRVHWSRQGKELIPEVVAHLHLETGGVTLDGELLLPPPFTFQESMAACKKFDPIRSPKFTYCVFDTMENEGHPFSERIQTVHRIVGGGGNANVIEVATMIVTSPDELATFHAEVTAAGFEGTIIRKPSGRYATGHRSADLLKLKDTQDDEFEIVGFEDGVGKEAEAIIFRCITADGQPFTVRPEGTYEERGRMYAQGERYIGKRLTVRYQVLTDGGIPLFPVGVTVRDYEEGA